MSIVGRGFDERGCGDSRRVEQGSGIRSPAIVPPDGARVGSPSFSFDSHRRALSAWRTAARRARQCNSSESTSPPPLMPGRRMRRDAHRHYLRSTASDGVIAIADPISRPRRGAQRARRRACRLMRTAKPHTALRRAKLGTTSRSRVCPTGKSACRECDGKARGRDGGRSRERSPCSCGGGVGIAMGNARCAIESAASRCCAATHGHVRRAASAGGDAHIRRTGLAFVYKAAASDRGRRAHPASDPLSPIIGDRDGVSS